MRSETDPEKTGASSTVCTPEIRVYRGGRLERETTSLTEIEQLQHDAERTTWVDLPTADYEALVQIAQTLHLHPLAIEDVEESHERAKLVRYETHLFLTLYAMAAPNDVESELERHQIDIFLTRNVVVTVRHGDGFDLGGARLAWEAHPTLLAIGGITVLWAIVDQIVDTHFDTVQQLDESIDALEDELFGDTPDSRGIQLNAYHLHKRLVTLRRLALPTREILSSVINRAEPPLPDALRPYFLDVYDHVLRVSDWTDSLRDLASTIIDTNLSSQSNRMNLVMKELTSWAAIIAVPTLITGFFGMNVNFPYFQTDVGAVIAVTLIALASVGLYAWFKRLDWL